MLHTLKYRFLQILRTPAEMFWGLGFPVILGLLFYVAFGSLGVDHFEPVDAAVVVESENESFSTFLGEISGEYVNLKEMTEIEAKDALDKGEIKGYFLENDEPQLFIAGSGLDETVLSSCLEGYESTAQIIQDTVDEHPEKLQEVLDELDINNSYITETGIGGKTYDNTLNYFFALIAMACFFGAWIGVEMAKDTCPNASALGIRRSVSPEKKSVLVFADILVATAIQFVNSVILIVFLKYVLKIGLPDNLGLVFLVCLMASLIGVAFGVCIGTSRKSEGFKSGMIILTTLGLCFLAGMMASVMKEAIERACPIINRINPAALVSDSFYCLTVYEDASRLTADLLTLGGISAALFIVAFLRMRRVRYDSI